jgi:hypothetical protein
MTANNCPNGCDHGLVEVGRPDPLTHGTWRPCDVCNAEAYERWAAGGYQKWRPTARQLQLQERAS